MIVNASALNRHCGYPRRLARVRPKSARVQAAADLGTAFHKAVEQWARTGHIPSSDECGEEVRGWVEVLAMQWVPPDGALLEVAMGLGVDGGYVPVVEAEPHVYVPDGTAKEALLTAGRADVVWLDVLGGKRIAMVRDWKTGKWPVDHPMDNLQLHALGLAAAGMLNADAYSTQVYYVRDGVMDMLGSVDLDSEQAADAWMAVEFAAMLDEQPRPGEHCGPCWERRLRRCSFAQK